MKAPLTVREHDGEGVGYRSHPPASHPKLLSQARPSITSDGDFDHQEDLVTAQ